ncbi:SPOR domain-containing protein [Cytobacillus sp. FJAT-54145]|uniref:SPOR domain-containing protein n=1 Tax=Cytobacillus spartinae TaxID=3299023 RepID=A0ABW6KKP7_9BACI
MDKSENGKTITIKINGKDRPLKETKENVEARQQSEHKKPDQNANEVEYTQVSEEVENLTHTQNTKNLSKELEEILSSQAAASQEAQEDNFDWILPDHIDDEEIKEYKIATPTKKKPKGLRGITGKLKKNNRNGMVSSIFFAVFFAVLLGTSFGFILLKLVIMDPSMETAGKPASVEELTEQAGEATNDSETGSTGGTSQLSVAPITGYVVQGGVFSTADAAKGMGDQVSQKGVATKIVNIGDKTFLFVGIADTLENAKSIGNKLKESGIEVFAKEVQFGSASQKELGASEKTILELAPPLYQAISAASTNMAISNSLPPNLVENIKAQQAEWSKIDEKSIVDKEVQQIKVELDSAASNVSAYLENPSENLKDKIQQNLLNFLAFYHSL